MEEVGASGTLEDRQTWMVAKTPTRSQKRKQGQPSRSVVKEGPRVRQEKMQMGPRSGRTGRAPVCTALTLQWGGGMKMPTKSQEHLLTDGIMHRKQEVLWN